jgi:hypothetical protein
MAEQNSERQVSPRLKKHPGLGRTLAMMSGRFFWSSPAATRTGPHIRDANSVQRLWNYFVVASLPAWMIGLWSLGRQTNYALLDFQLESVPGWRAALLERLGLGFDPFNLLDCVAHGLLYFGGAGGGRFLASVVCGSAAQAARRGIAGGGLVFRPDDAGLGAPVPGRAWHEFRYRGRQAYLRRIRPLPRQSRPAGAGIPGFFLSLFALW